jgi:hypothetical protein
MILLGEKESGEDPRADKRPRAGSQEYVVRSFPPWLWLMIMIIATTNNMSV